MLDLSGRAAATSSIFPNCHGKRDGYKNGRMSKPVGYVSTLVPAAPIQSTHDCHQDCTLPGKRNEVITSRSAMHGRTYGVVRWRERRHLVPVACVLKVEQLHLIRNLPWRQPRPPLVH